jgi:hypothetical protein
LHRVTKNITAILLEAGVVTVEQVERGVQRQRETGLRIGETLVEMGAVTEEDVGWALSRQLGLSFVDLDPEALDPALVRDFHETLLRRSDAVPLLRGDAGVSIAVADPTDDLALDRLEAAAGAPLSLVIGTPTAIRRALDHVLGPRRVAAPVEVAPGSSAPGDRGGRHYDVVWERSGDTFLAFHVATALRRGAREIHFLPGSGQVHVHYREAGRLVEVAAEPVRMQDSLLARIEALGGPAAGGSLHARGPLRCPVPQGDVLLDASLLRTPEGASITLVLHSQPSGPPGLEELGVDPADAAELREALSRRAGLVLIGGPRSAGGSSLLAALGAVVAGPGTRALAFETGVAATTLSGVTRLVLDPDEARAAWAGVAVAQRADVVLLDDVLAGEAIAGVLDGAAARRLLLVRTDGCDTGALLERLLAAPGARGLLGRRLLAMLQVRRVEAAPPFLVEVLLPGESVRTAIEEGAAAPSLLALAAAAGFRTLAQRGAERIASGTLEPAELARALA